MLSNLPLCYYLLDDVINERSSGGYMFHVDRALHALKQGYCDGFCVLDRSGKRVLFTPRQTVERLMETLLGTFLSTLKNNLQMDFRSLQNPLTEFSKIASRP